MSILTVDSRYGNQGTAHRQRNADIDWTINSRWRHARELWERQRLIVSDRLTCESRASRLCCALGIQVPGVNDIAYCFSGVCLSVCLFVCVSVYLSVRAIKVKKLLIRKW